MLTMLKKGVFRLNKKQWMIPLSALMIVGAAGCANDYKRPGVNERNNALNPVGYYSNENHPQSEYGFFRDNDGAVTDIMDRTIGDDDRTIRDRDRQLLQTRDENGNPKNPTTPLAENDRNWFRRDNRFSRSDLNYHGHLNRNTANTGTATNQHTEERISDQIRVTVAEVENVRSIRSVSYGNNVTVSVKLTDPDRADETKRAIKAAVQPLVNGKPVDVMIDEGAIGRDRNNKDHFPQRKTKR